MSRARLEAFSDGVIAILITIMVLELKVPRGASWEAVRPVLPVFLTYVLSFVYLAIYWNNHHHMFHTVDRISGTILWANLHLLFWLSLIPFVTGWAGQNHFAAWPAALYGAILLCAGCAYVILTRTLIAHHSRESALAIAVGRDVKGKISLVCYAVAIPLSFVHAWLAWALYVLVAVTWLIPDRRIEKVLAQQ